MGIFVLGILFGWLLEWLFFTYYWKPNHNADTSTGESSVEDLKQQLASKEVEISTLKAKASAAAKEATPEPKALVKKPAKKASAPTKAAAEKAKTKTVKTKAAPKKAASTVAFNKQLQKISGIGPKISGVLTGSGISSYETLADTDSADLEKILSASGTKYAMIDFTSWPKQARLLANGDAAGLAKLQESLKK